MDLKYLSDAKGTITGVFIPIADWEQLQKQYNISLTAKPDSGAQFQQSLHEALKNAKE
jgi:hypothetical protein